MKSTGEHHACYRNQSISVCKLIGGGLVISIYSDKQECQTELVILSNLLGSSMSEMQRPECSAFQLQPDRMPTPAGRSLTQALWEVNCATQYNALGREISGGEPWCLTVILSRCQRTFCPFPETNLCQYFMQTAFTLPYQEHPCICSPLMEATYLLSCTSSSGACTEGAQVHAYISSHALR